MRRNEGELNLIIPTHYHDENNQPINFIHVFVTTYKAFEALVRSSLQETIRYFYHLSGKTKKYHLGSHGFINTITQKGIKQSINKTNSP